MTAKNPPRPVPPIQPDIDDCCGTGCNPCIFDVYEDALDRYRIALKIWEEQAAASIARPRAASAAPAARTTPVGKTAKKLAPRKFGL